MQASFQGTSVRLNYRYVETPLGRMHLAEAGEGPPLLMLHSTPHSHRQFLPLLAGLTTRFHVVAPDTLGFGASDPLPEDASLEQLGDATAALLERLDLTPVDVYGFHTGNKVAAALAQRHPARVRRVILAGQTHSMIPEKEPRDAAIWKIVKKYFAGAGPEDHAVDPVRKWAADFATVSNIWWNSAVLTDPSVDPKLLGGLERYAIDYMLSRHSLMPIYRANFAFDFGATVRGIAAPTRILELVTSAEEHLGRQADRLAALLPRGSAVTLEDGGIDLHESRPQDLVAQIIAFCAGASA